MTDYLESTGELTVLRPGWPAPSNVRAAASTRIGGVSAPPYDSLNLGDHVGDEPRAVAENRRRLGRVLHLPNEPIWLRQVHGTRVVSARKGAGVEADAICADRAESVCAVLTADCLPVLFCDRAGTRIAAAHAGWRGLQAGILESTLDAFNMASETVLAWLGPAIGPAAFEVGTEVREAFLASDPGAGEAFRPSPSGRWCADLYGLARRRLRRAGIGGVYGGGYCTYTDAERFYSYRRDGVTGRMATLIWMED
ncbi:peptidoglycan editing factor PgeF [Thiohalomonas denitrificans]|uniref:peptidoglycan editing factor PgeF n=1 Tax=Thiohalomonas denitrificans TaxID=415747 RepID=UPI0026ED84E4|nr:peptidoglycan editing factor PgeF [Thiohalomonas denitrificans]